MFAKLVFFSEHCVVIMIDVLQAYLNKHRENNKTKHIYMRDQIRDVKLTIYCIQCVKNIFDEQNIRHVISDNRNRTIV